MYIYNISVHASEDFFPKRAFHGGSFYQKIFSWETFGGNLWGRGFYLKELMIRSCQGRGELCKCISQ